MSAIGYIAVCDYCGEVFEIKDRASLNIAKAMMDAIEEKIVANGDHECKCHKPVIPSFEEIEKEIEESEQHLPQVVAAPIPAGDGSIDDEQKPLVEEPLPNLEQSDSGPEKSDDSEDEVVKKWILGKNPKPDMSPVNGFKQMEYAVVDDDVLIRYYSAKVGISIETVKRLTELSDSALRDACSDYLDIQPPHNKVTCLIQFIRSVRNGVVNLEQPKVEEITHEEVAQEEVKPPSPPPRKIPPTLSHEMLRQRGLL